MYNLDGKVRGKHEYQSAYSVAEVVVGTRGYQKVVGVFNSACPDQRLHFRFHVLGVGGILYRNWLCGAACILYTGSTEVQSNLLEVQELQTMKMRVQNPGFASALHEKSRCSRRGFSNVWFIYAFSIRSE